MRPLLTVDLRVKIILFRWLQKIETIKLTCAGWVLSQGMWKKKKDVLSGERTFEHWDFFL